MVPIVFSWRYFLLYPQPKKYRDIWYINPEGKENTEDSADGSEKKSWIDDDIPPN